MHQNMSTFSCIRPFVFMRMPGRFPAVNSSTLYSASARKQKSPDSVMNQSFKRCVRDFNLYNQEISQNCNILIIIKLLQINYITKYH